MALVDKDFEVGQLQFTVTEMQMTIAQQDEKISDQTDEMNKAFLVYVLTDLKEKGLISKKAVSGMGRKKPCWKILPTVLSHRST